MTESSFRGSMVGVSVLGDPQKNVGFFLGSLYNHQNKDTSKDTHTHTHTHVNMITF